MTAPIVSVLVPAFNAGQFIGDALASLDWQSLTNYEAIVIDDASTDDTAERVEAAAQRNPRIRLLRLAMNLGPSGARNAGIKFAAGRWLSLLDADDRYVPKRLQTLVDLAERHGVEMCSDNLMLDMGGSALPRPMIPLALLADDRDIDLTEFVARTMPDPAWPGVNFGFLKPIIRRDFLLRTGIRYDEQVRFAEDFGLYVDCLRAGARWRIHPDATYIYRVRGDSLTQVQTVGDLDRLLVKLAILEHDGCGELSAAAHLQFLEVKRRRNYRAFTDAIKARHFAIAAQLLFRERCYSTGIMLELSRQSPTILRKLVSGGYISAKASRSGQ